MNDKNIEEILKEVAAEDIPADVHKIAQQVSADFSRTLLQTKKQHILWEHIIRSSITKLAAAAVIIAAVFIGIHHFGSPIESTAFADVMQNIQNARTLTYQSVFTTEDQKPQVAKTMVLEPNLMRVELPEGRVWILDHGQGKTLLLDSKNKEAEISTTPQKALGLYDTFRQFRNNPDFSVRQIGQREIDGMKVIGFQLTKENDENVIIVWANPQNSLPIRIEQTTKDGDGKVIKSVTPILFSMPNWTSHFFASKYPRDIVADLSMGQLRGLSNSRNALRRVLT